MSEGLSSLPRDPKNSTFILNQGSINGNYRDFGMSLEEDIGHALLESATDISLNTEVSDKNSEHGPKTPICIPPPITSESPLPQYEEYPQINGTLLTLENGTDPTSRGNEEIGDVNLDSAEVSSVLRHEATQEAKMKSNLQDFGKETPFNNEAMESNPPNVFSTSPEEPKYAKVEAKHKRNSRLTESKNGTPQKMRRGMMINDEISVFVSGEEDVTNLDQESSVMPLLPSIEDQSIRSGNRVQHSSKFSVIRTVPLKEEINPDDCIIEWQYKASDSLQSIITALYCKLLVILGLAFPMSEVISENVPSGYYQLFYLYLFLGSLLYLLFTYIDLFRTRTKASVKHLKAHKKGSKSKNIIKKTSEVDGSEEKPCTKEMSKKISLELLIPRPRVHYGSFYLRLGAVLFGIGSMIYSGIEIGMFFELNLDEESDCKNLFSILRPILQMTFVFAQMYFIFLNQKMNVFKNKLLSRFGMMHMIATNLCVWLNVLIMETNHEILENKRHRLQSYTDDKVGNGSQGGENQGVGDIWNHQFEINHLISLCHRKNNIMSKLLTDSGPFLFPCTIEYSLICAAVLFIMWRNIGEEHEFYRSEKKKKELKSFTYSDINSIDNMPRSAHHYSVDCTHANTGLFTGIFVMVLTIISLIVFFVLISSANPTLQFAAITVASVTELTLYCVTTLAVLIGMCQVRSLWYDTSRKLQLDNLLLIVAQTGVIMYASFSIIGSFFQINDHLLAFLASLATLIQTLLQTVFILDASNRFAYNTEQVKAKPGREVVTFLLVCNLAMWAINTLETNRADSHPIQVKFYGGDWVWPIITHVSMPLAIFYRFHSTVCLCEIWKKSFKYKVSNQNHV